MPSLDVDVGAVHDNFYRHIPHDGDPLHQPPDPEDGRWHHAALIEAWYLADSPDTVWAEWYRALAELGARPSAMLPRDLWRWRIDLEHVALLDSVERLRRVGLERPLPTSSLWAAYQNVGDGLYREGYRALLVVSAARPEAHNLVVFRHRREVRGCTPDELALVVREAPVVPVGLRT